MITTELFIEAMEDINKRMTYIEESLLEVIRRQNIIIDFIEVKIPENLPKNLNQRRFLSYCRNS